MRWCPRFDSTGLTFSQNNNEYIKKINSLNEEAEKLRKQDAALQDRLAKLSALEQDNASLFKDKADLLEQLGKLNMELTQAKESCIKVNKELSSLTADLEAARAQNDNLKSENNELLSKQQKLAEQAKNATQAATVHKNENITLKTQVNQLQSGGSGPLSGSDRYVLEQEIRDMTAQKETLQKALDEWTALAKVSPP